MFPIFVGSVHNFGKTDDDIIQGVLVLALFSEKVLISNRCISGLMPNLIKKSWTDCNIELIQSMGQKIHIKGNKDGKYE